MSRWYRLPPEGEGRVPRPAFRAVRLAMLRFPTPDSRFGDSMDWFVRNFVKASLTWFGLGVTLGVCMAVHPPWTVYRPAHMHMNLLGFVTMMIYGVAYHVMPRFVGNPLHSRRLAAVHWWLANTGLALVVIGFVWRAHGGAPAGALLGVGALLSALGAYAFIFNIWRTIDGRAAVRRVAATAPIVELRREPPRHSTANG